MLRFEGSSNTFTFSLAFHESVFKQTKKKNTKKTNHSLFAKVHAQIFEFGKPAGKGLDYLLPPTISLQDTLCLSQP